MSFDIEKLIVDLDTFFKANLNSRITAINAEKNDSIVLASIDSAAFIVGDQDTKNKSYNPYVLIELENVTSEFRGRAIAENYEIVILMFLQDDYNIIDNWKLTLRYWRAIKETALAAWDKVARGMQADVSSLTPVDIQVNNSSNPMKVFGARISFTIQ